MTKTEQERFACLRKRVAERIKKDMEDGCDCKPYDGTWELLISFPDNFADPSATAAPDFFRITLYCSVLCPGRHCDWDGMSWDEALCACERDVDGWLEREAEDAGR